MYAYIKGTLVESTPLKAIIETAGGIAFTLFIPPNVLGQLPQTGKAVTLHTSFVVRENEQALYGFSTRDERDVFEMLLDVSGIGPKIALAIIGHLTLPELSQAIVAADVPMLCRIPGIGKKGAERLILELKDKLSRLPSLAPALHQTLLPSCAGTQKIQDAVSALMNLGYNQAVAQKAVKKTIDLHQEHLDLPALITHSLKHMYTEGNSKVGF